MEPDKEIGRKGLFFEVAFEDMKYLIIYSTNDR